MENSSGVTCLLFIHQCLCYLEAKSFLSLHKGSLLKHGQTLAVLEWMEMHCWYLLWNADIIPAYVTKSVITHVRRAFRMKLMLLQWYNMLYMYKHILSHNRLVRFTKPPLLFPLLCLKWFVQLLSGCWQTDPIICGFPSNRMWKCKSKYTNDTLNVEGRQWYWVTP